MKLKVAVVCSSNMNRSMEAHSVLAKKNFSVSSYGTGNQIKIPGKSKHEPNIYPFGKKEGGTNGAKNFIAVWSIAFLWVRKNG